VDSLAPGVDLGESTTTAHRRRTLCSAIADSLKQRPVLCELLAVSVSVLERNISIETASTYKTHAVELTSELAVITRRVLPELSPKAAFRLASYVFVAVAGVWPMSRPSDAMRTATRSPHLAAVVVPFDEAITQILTDLLIGLMPAEP
jgi:Tetracyclin repressor-like, C-terminal domain